MAFAEVAPTSAIRIVLMAAGVRPTIWRSAVHPGATLGLPNGLRDAALDEWASLAGPSSEAAQRISLPAVPWAESARWVLGSLFVVRRGLLDLRRLGFVDL